ncbi:MAG TPA: HmuY family protein [Chitinophagaceae bacterium]|nr:HmuY family protein [Chitinophagaceae bacterium]
MIKGTIIRTLYVLLAASIFFAACRKREGLSLSDNYVIFESNAQGIVESENSITVKVKLSRGTDKDIPVSINLTPQGVVYGTDFTTTPAAMAGSLSVTIPPGNDEASFTINKVPGVLFDGDEKIIFNLYSSAAPVLIGATRQFTLSFAELVANSSSYTIDGGGATYPNKVFLDLSANRQTKVLRTNWDLGFYTAAGADSFRVILNSSVGMMAKQLNKNDLNTVTSADTLGLSLDLAYSPFTPVPSQMAYVDYPTGDISRTAISMISPVAGDNKVYIINRGSGIGTPALSRGWKKIRIIRNSAGGYTLQHADIAATTFTSVDIAKDEAYFFKYISLDNGPVSVEPEKKKWDIAWTYFGNTTNFGGGEVPYLFQDFIIQNRNVAIAKVLTTTKTYESFTAANLADGTITAWSTSQTAIGADWRRTTPSPAQTYADRFYIIRDGENNYYKVKFTSLTEGGIRGFPAIAYELIKRG